MLDNKRRATTTDPSVLNMSLRPRLSSTAMRAYGSATSRPAASLRRSPCFKQCAAGWPQ
jgi:hypothetical protein